MPLLGTFLVEAGARQMIVDWRKGEKPSSSMRLRQGKQTFVAYIEGENGISLDHFKQGDVVEVRGVQCGEMILTNHRAIKASSN